MTADQIIDRRTAPLVGHMNAGRSGLLPEQRGGEMIGRAGARGRERDLAGFFFRCSISSATVFAGNPGSATSTFGVRTNNMTADRNPSRAVGKVRNSAALIANTPIDRPAACTVSASPASGGPRRVNHSRRAGSPRRPVCPTRSAALWGRRAVISDAPPGGKGTMTEMLRSGYSARMRDRRGGGHERGNGKQSRRRMISSVPPEMASLRRRRASAAAEGLEPIARCEHDA